MTADDGLRPGTAADEVRLRDTIALSRQSPPAPDHYAVGCLIAGPDGAVLATGYTGQGDPKDHAEEGALARVRGQDLSGATLYSSLEPCTIRKSRPCSCTDLILAAGIRRVVFALREPLFFVDCSGVETLQAHGVEVIEIASLGPQVAEVNAHILGRTAVVRR